MRSVRVLFATVVAALAPGVPAAASVFVVNATGDGVGQPGNCPPINRATAGDIGTLPATCRIRDAVAAANLLSGADEIVINLPGTVAVTLLATLEVNESLDFNAAPLAGQNIFASFTLIGGPGVDELLKVTAGETQLRRLRLTLADIDIAAGNLVFDQPENGTFAEKITGAGSLEKDGTATLTLTGTNDFTGGTTVSGGTLRGNTLSLPGNIAVTTGASLVFDQATGDPAAFTGVLSGAGSIEKLGDGTLDLQTVNTFTGTTTITAGTLQGFVGSLKGDIIDNAKLVFTQAADANFTDDISGSGSVQKTGPGTLTLSGNNTFGGGLIISQGVVIGNASSIRGNVSVAPDMNAQLVFDQADAGTHSGNISGGSGALPTVIKRGVGTLTLTGNNSFVGDLSIEAGAVVGSTTSIPGNVVFTAGSTSLVFDQGTSGTFNGVITGPGTLTKRGTGSVSLTQTQAFTGSPTTIEAGTLVVGVTGQGAGSGTLLPGDVVIQSAGTLEGIGHVAGGVTANGTVSPAGSAAGTLHVGSVAFASGSTFAVNVSNGGGDLLQVDGNAAIASGTVLDVALTGVAPGADFTQQVLTAGDITANGPFTVENDLAFFTLAAIVDDGANTVSVDVTPNGTVTLVGLAQTPNQRAVATALTDALAAPHDPDLDVVFGSIVELTTAAVPQALADMSGEQLTEFATTRLAIGDRFQSSMQERIRGVAWNDGEALISQQQQGREPVLAANPWVSRQLPGFAAGGTWPVAFGGQSMSSVLDSSTGFGPGPGELGLGGWLDGYGLFGSLDGDSGSDNLDYLIGGFSLGVDYRIADNWLVGLAGGYAHSELDFDNLSGNQSAETGQGALYAGYVSPWLQVGASGRFGYSAMSTSRSIDFIDRDADADFDGFDAGGRVEAALDLFEVRGVEIQPLASIAYTHVQQDEIDESGADTLNLTTDEQDIDSVTSGVGARVHGVIRIDEQLWLHPELRARWVHEFGDTERELSASIGGSPGQGFDVTGAEVPTDAGVIGIGWTLISAGRMHAFIDYDVTVASELIQHGVAVGFKIVW